MISWLNITLCFNILYVCLSHCFHEFAYRHHESCPVATTSTATITTTCIYRFYVDNSIELPMLLLAQLLLRTFAITVATSIATRIIESTSSVFRCNYDRNH